MRTIQFFIRISGGILLALAMMRFLIAMGSEQVLGRPEPLLGIPIRYAVLLVGGLELSAGLMCLIGRRPGIQLGWLAWLSTNCLVYQIGLVVQQFHPQGAALGLLTDPLQLAGGMAGRFLLVVPGCLAVGSYAAIVGLWRQGRQATALTPAQIKMSCPGCGTRIKFASQNLGQRTHCPQCQTTITLRQPDLLKMPCFFCHGHIEFPSHSIGEKIVCPHCKMDITLKEPT